MAMLNPVHIAPHGAQFQQYPFPPASIFPDRLLAWDAVREMIPAGTPPEIRTHRGEVLFVPASQREALAAAAGQMHIPCVRRVDIWSWILEPFLDTEFDARSQAASRAILEQNGVPAPECEALRSRFGELMVAYNFDTGLWEWVHLGLYDLLSAHCLFQTRFQVSGADFAARYWEAMEIAERAGIVAD